MKTFRQYITESSWNKPNIFYHATDKDFDPNKLEPGSHLGTLQAAMARVSEKISSLEDEHDRHSNSTSEGRMKRKKIRNQIRNIRNNTKVHVYRHTGNLNSIEKVDDADLNWDKPQTKTVKYKNMYEDPGSTSVRTGINSENEFEHIHTFKSPKFTTRKYYKTLLGQGHPAADEEYLRKKNRI